MVRVLAVADEVDERLSGARARALAPDLVVSAGDLPWHFLEELADHLDVPVVFVPGNHDPEVATGRWHRSGMFLRAGLPVDAPRPHGCTGVDGEVVEVAGLRVAGLGGCVRYRPGPNQYTQAEHGRRAARLVRRVERLQRREGGGLDLLLTHAPPLGLGDEEDRPHVGVEALHGVIERLRPTWHLHGHIHPYGQPRPDRRLGRTTIRNVVPYKVLEVEPREVARAS